MLAARRLTVSGGLLLALAASPQVGAGDPRDGGSGSPAPSFSGNVVAVHDGDTISVMRDGRALRVRLEGIDCPEQGQAFGQRAKEATRELVFRRVVVVEDHGRDRYGRTLGRVTVDGLDVNLELVRIGMAWHYKQHSRSPALAAAERDARAEKRGLWSQDEAVAPWQWRAARR